LLNTDVAIQSRRENVRRLMLSAQGRFAAVEFIKQDGNVRVMRFQPAAAKKHVAGDAASDAAKARTATRKANNPNHMAVWDTERKAFRTVDLDTVLAVKVDGTRYAVA